MYWNQSTKYDVANNIIHLKPIKYVYMSNILCNRFNLKNNTYSSFYSVTSNFFNLSMKKHCLLA